MEQMKKTADRKIVNRLAKASGHLDAVRRMLEDGKDCRDVLLQLSAVRSAIMKTEKLLLRDYIRQCMDEAAAGDETDTDCLDRLNDTIDRFMK